jgi:uncharacterized membrane protein (TIGR02234 family)
VIDRLSAKRTVLVVMLVAASIILISGSQEWVSGSTGDVGLGAGALQGRGSDVASGAMAAALVGLASAVVAATSGTVVRAVAAFCALMAAVLGATVIILVLVDPNGALGNLAAASTGRSGTLAAHGQAGIWAWAALAAMIVMGLGGLGALVGRQRWRGLSARYDSGEPPAGHGSAWDQLSRGEDPTAET